MRDTTERKRALTGTATAPEQAIVHTGSAEQGPSGPILVAEDNPVNQLVMTAMLESLGFRVDVVSDGAAAVNAATLTRYEAILMDCQMPSLDGYQATSEIRRLQGTAERTPIIGVTSSAGTSDRERWLAAGMDDYLTKPLGLDVLATALGRWAPDGAGPTAAVEPAEAGPPAAVAAADVSDPDLPALDAQVVDRLERLGHAVGEDLMQQLADLFLADADDRVGALREALAANDARALARAAHTLSGASANIGATELARLCAALPTESATEDLVVRGALLDAVEAELGRVRSALDVPRTATP